MSIQSETAGLVQCHKDNIGYLEKFGSPIEKAMVQVVLAAARGDISEENATKTRSEYQYFAIPESRSYRDNIENMIRVPLAFINSWLISAFGGN